jgi:hypothetical protein
MDQLLCSQEKIVFKIETKLLSNYDDAVLQSRCAWETKLVTGRKGGQQQRVTSTQLHPPSLVARFALRSLNKVRAKGQQT